MHGVPAGLDALIPQRQVIIQNRRPGLLYFDGHEYSHLEESKYGYALRDGYTGYFPSLFS